MSAVLPFKVDYAKSSRSNCRGCKTTILKDDIRLAVMVQSPMFDGKIPQWYHFDCFFMKQRPKALGDIDGAGTIKYEDQKRIEQRISGKASTGKAKDLSAVLNDFSTEYAKSNQSTCRGCLEKIAKGLVRISKKDYDSEKAKAYGPVPAWYHVDCFIKHREELQWELSGDKLPGFKALGVDDQKLLKEKIKKIVLKRPAEATVVDGPPEKKAKNVQREDAILKKQSDQIFKCRKLLEDNVKHSDLQELLAYNSQAIPPGKPRMYDRLSDIMVFGSPKHCPECKTGQLVFKTNLYKCQGNYSEFTACPNEVSKPERVPFVAPTDLLEKYDFLKKYVTGKTKDRVVSSSLLRSTASTSGVTARAVPKFPLRGCPIVLGKTTKSIDELKARISTLGAKIEKKITNSTLCLLSTQAEVDKNAAKIRQAKEHDVHVLSEDFLWSIDLTQEDIKIDPTPFKLCDWGGDFLTKIQHSKTSYELKSGKSNGKSRFKSASGTVRLKVHGGAAVDHESGLEDVAHVYQPHKGEIYSAVLQAVDLQRDKNSFYKLQLLEANNKRRYYVFRAWGRVGTTIGGTKVEEFDTMDDARELYENLYLEKSGNHWHQRHDFVKKPNMFYPLDIDYGNEDAGEGMMKKLHMGNNNSKLSRPIQELICLIFDVEAMKKTLTEFELDLEKMPLGKLSKKQVRKGYEILTELQNFIENKASRMQIIDATNRFYTLIPHVFGTEEIDVLDTIEKVKPKVEMLDSLLEIEVACEMLKAPDEDTKEDPIDFHYRQLKTEIELLSPTDETFQLLQRYVSSTHAETHTAYDLEVMEIFRVNRHGEEQRYKPFRRLHNRKLLWHGSRISNFAGIFSQGLRIAPPEAPATGYMFGKGIYFADMVSKSANYCCTSVTNPVGLLLLCEVALGDMHQCTQAEFVTKLPPKKHSTMGVGMTTPAIQNAITLPDGVVVPMGPGQKTDAKTSLLYNEYIVYDIAQVNIKYLLKVNFKYKY